MNIEVSVLAVNTIHTNTEDPERADQPVIEFTVRINKAGSTNKYTVKFTEMLSELAPLTNAQLLDRLTAMVAGYVRSVYGAGDTVVAALDPVTHNWIKAASIVGKTYTVTI